MKPEYSEYLSCSARWYGSHKGVKYELVHHGISDYQPEGIWCAYIYIYEHEAEDFDKFYCPNEVKKFIDSSPYRVTNDYYSIPDMGFSGGITFYKNENYPHPKTGEPARSIKIGCDYNHLWDAERGYPDTLESVRHDTEALIEKYLDAGYKISNKEQQS